MKPPKDSKRQDYFFSARLIAAAVFIIGSNLKPLQIKYLIKLEFLERAPHSHFLLPHVFFAKIQFVNCKKKLKNNNLFNHALKQSILTVFNRV